MNQYTTLIGKNAFTRTLKQSSLLQRSVKGKLPFDFATNKNKLIADLNWLTSLSVEEFTFRKKFEEIQSVSPFLSDYAAQAKTKLWRPTDLHNENLTIKEINQLEPILVVVTEPEQERLWLTLSVYCSSAEFEQSPGRFIKFLLLDNVTGKVLGITAIASDFISMSERDDFIGWTSQDKLDGRMLKHSAIGKTIIPTQPFGSNFFGGKLLAAMVTSGVVRNAWENQIGGESKSCKLVGLTTTSLYGSFSMYNSLKWWKAVGSTKGKIPIKPYEDVYKDWHNWLKDHRANEYEDTMTQRDGISGPVTGAKMRVLGMIFDAVGIKQSEFCHGHERGIYYSCFYENTKEFLCRRIAERDLKIKPLIQADTKAILDWWLPKAIERYKKLKAVNRLNPKKLFYSSMKGMGYEVAKEQFFDGVGK